MKTRVLIISDSPLIESGQGNVHRHVGLQLHKLGYEIISIGWHDDYTEIKVPWQVYRTTKEHYYGQLILNGVVQQHRPDIVITIGDTWNYEYITKSHVRHSFYWIGYTAIDGIAFNSRVPSSWIPTLKDMDKVIAYTEYGKQALEASLPDESGNIPIIPHGVDLNVFKPLPKKEIAQLRATHRIPEDYTIFLTVARNQPRKNIPELFKAWAQFKTKSRYAKAVLWPHMVFNDNAGWNISELLDICSIKDSIMYLEEFAHASSCLNTVSEEKLNILYNLADVFVLVSGEGFGLPLIEAMACGKPVIALNHSATGELAKGHGELVKVSSYVTGVRPTERPLPDTTDLVSKFETMYEEVELREKYSKASLAFAQDFSWDKIGLMWDSEIKKIMNPFSSTCKLSRIS